MEISLDRLDDGGLARVADYLASRPKASPNWAQSNSKVAKSLRGRLQIARDGKLVAFDPGARPEPDIYLIYFGAHWCPPVPGLQPEAAGGVSRPGSRPPPIASRSCT